MPEEVIPEVLKESVEGSSEAAKEVAPTLGAPEVEMSVSPEVVPEKTEGKYNELLSKVAPSTATPTDDQAVVLDAKHIGAMTDEESKVQKLLDLASAKGVVYAIKVTRSLKDYYALDRVHDDLANKLYDGLLAKGLIGKE